MQSKIIKTQSITPTTHLFVLEKPDGFSHQPGQFILVTQTIADCDQRCNRRPFSIVSPPHAAHLQFATKYGTSRFKQELLHKGPGNALSVLGPMGEFGLTNTPQDKPIVLLAGGIGITPLHSILVSAAHTGDPRKITLLYSAKNPQEFAFKDTLDRMATQQDNIRIVYTTTNKHTPQDMQESHHDPAIITRRGRITAELIMQQIAHYQHAHYYICGPIAMVAGLTEQVVNLGIPTERIKSEQFSGY